MVMNIMNNYSLDGSTVMPAVFVMNRNSQLAVQ